MLASVLGMQVLDQLIAVGEVDGALRQRQATTICQVNVKIFRRTLMRGDLTGNVYGMDLLHHLRQTPRERQIARADLKHCGLAREQRRQEVQLTMHLRSALARVASAKLRMVRDFAEQLVVRPRVQRFALLRRSLAQALRQLTLDPIVLTQLLGGTGVLRPASRRSLQSAIGSGPRHGAII